MPDATALRQAPDPDLWTARVHVDNRTNFQVICYGRGTVQNVETDILGSGYLRRTFDLGSDDEGPVVATLVSRPAPRSTGRAVLYVHGYAD